MAFYNAEEDEDQQDANAAGPEQQGPTGSQIITGGEGGGSANPTSAPKSSGPDKSGNFVGIQQYLSANKPQAAKLGDQVAGVINTSADSARQGVQNLQTEAQNQIKAVSPLSNDVSGKIDQAETLTPEERLQVKQTAGAKYTGPADETKLGDAYTNAAKAQKTAVSNIDNSGTEQGRMGLISQVNSKPRTAGINIFDNALVQAGGGREKLAQASAANQDVKGGLDAASQAIRGQIGRADDPNTPEDESAGAIGQTNQAASSAQKRIQDALASWQSGFQPKVQAAQDAFNQKQTALTSDIADNPYQLDAGTLEMLGLQGREDLYDLDLNNYINNSSIADINAGNVADQTDYARYGALSDLAGISPSLLDPTKASMAGTAPKSSVNQGKLKEDLGNKQKAYEQAYATTKDITDRTDFPGYTSNPNSAGDVDLSNHMQALKGATVEQLENYFLPMFSKSDTRIASGIEKALNRWKASQHQGNIVNAPPKVNETPVIGANGPNPGGEIVIPKKKG